MKRTLLIVGAAVIAIASAAAASQAQESTGEQRQGAFALNCGPGRDGGGPGGGAALQRGGRPGAPGMRMQGPGRGIGGRQGGVGPGRPGRFGGHRSPLCGLDLSQEQKSQIEAIHQKAREDVAAVLTPEQKEKLRARR